MEKKFERQRKKKIVNQKNCQECGKLMRREDYLLDNPSYKNRGEASWKTRKYCSKLCMRNHQNKLMKENYSIIHIRKELKKKIMGLKYGKMATEDVLDNLFENLKRHYGHEFMVGVQPNETPCIIKILCLQNIKSGKIGEKEKGDTFLAHYKERDQIGEFWRGDNKFRIVNIISKTK